MSFQHRYSTESKKSSSSQGSRLSKRMSLSSKSSLQTPDLGDETSLQNHAKNPISSLQNHAKNPISNFISFATLGPKILSSSAAAADTSDAAALLLKREQDAVLMVDPTTSASQDLLHQVASINTIYDADLNSPGLFKVPPKKRASIMTSTIDLCNTILGTGIVSLPYAFSTIGLGFGSVFVILSVWTTWFSLRLLVVSAQNAHGTPAAKHSYSLVSQDGEPSFSSIGQVVFGRKGSAIMDIIVALACLGFAISYLVSIGDCMPSLMKGLMNEESLNGSYSFLVNRYFWMIVFLVLIIPLCLAKSVDDFSWFSITALLCAVYLAITIIVESFITDIKIDTGPITWFILQKSSVDCIPIFIFAFTCHQNIFTIYKDIDANYMHGEPLDTRTLNHIYAVIDLSVICVGTVYLVVGWLGFLMFGQNTKIIILDNYETNLAIHIARFLYSLLAALSIPIQTHPCRIALESLLCNYNFLSTTSTGTYNHFSTPLLSIPLEQESQRRHILALAILFVTYIIAFCIPNLDKLLAFVGATGGVTMCFIVPTIFFIRLADWETKTEQMALATWISFFGILCGTAQLLSVILYT